jgi:hypothetical protein
MQLTISTAEAAEVFGVTSKTICEWAKVGLLEKVSHGKYDLKKSLKNWAEYQRCIGEGADYPMDRWMIRQELAWSEAHHSAPVDVTNLRPLPELETFELELVARGRVVRARPAST